MWDKSPLNKFRQTVKCVIDRYEAVTSFHSHSKMFEFVYVINLYFLFPVRMSVRFVCGVFCIFNCLILTCNKHLVFTVKSRYLEVGGTIFYKFKLPVGLGKQSPTPNNG